jgi:hypothetical protein
VSDLNIRYSDWPKHNYQSEESASIPKEEIVKLFEFVESEVFWGRPSNVIAYAINLPFPRSPKLP